MSFAGRLTLTFALLLGAFGTAMLTLGAHVAAEREAAALQTLSAGLARHVVEHWPVVRATHIDATDAGSRERLIEMLMTVNPGIQVYTLDAQGKVVSYLGPPGMVREHQVSLQAIQRFLAGAPLPLRGTDPMTGHGTRLFSAAMFPPTPGESAAPGYLYIVLDGVVRRDAAGSVQNHGLAYVGTTFALGVVGLTLALGAWAFARQAHAERELIRAERERELAATHREHMAQLAHDLRTPLTALHGLLEALPEDEGVRSRALAQSNRVRRLTQQLFELAALEAMQEVTQRAPFALDELVSDTVQKFGSGVQLDGPAPSRIEVQGDWQLVERALSNLIENALRYAKHVRVTLTQEGGDACIRVEDDGPGLPDALAARLSAGASLRGLPLPRAGGGIGGLGLAIAQRVAILHGGRLAPLPTASGSAGACLGLALPIYRE